MAQYFGAELVGIARLETRTQTIQTAIRSPYSALCCAEYDPRVSPGIGGQVPVQNGLFITFVLSAWIRELGFRASVAPHLEAEALAAQAGLGTLNADGRLVTPQFGAKVYIADAICTDLPLAEDG